LPAKFSLAHCPRSHNYFGHPPFQFSRLRKLGFNISLGTDSLASNDDLSLFAEMRQFQKIFPDVSPREILEMVTVNPARALNHEGRLGQLRPGAFADLIAIPDQKDDVFDQITQFRAKPLLVKNVVDSQKALYFSQT
jgi:cytosine/adenosine deaminase-related metal-dependent hydrolase